MSDWPPRPPDPADTEPLPARNADAPPVRPAGPSPRNADAPSVRAAGPSSRPTGDNRDAEADAPRPSANRRALTRTIVIVAALLVVGGVFSNKVAAPGAPTFPPVGATPGPAGAAAEATRVGIVAALGKAGVQVESVLAPYRPAEAARLATAPRTVLRAIIPGDPDHGRIVIYELLSAADATSAAEDQATYVASGVGRVQFPTGTQFVLRVVGSTVIFYSWAGSSTPDQASAAAIAGALETQGFGVAVPN